MEGGGVSSNCLGPNCGSDFPGTGAGGVSGNGGRGVSVGGKPVGTSVTGGVSGKGCKGGSTDDVDGRDTGGSGTEAGCGLP